MTEEEAEMLGHAAAMDSLRDHYQAPKHAEPDLTEAMEVWREARDVYEQFIERPNQAAARVIATALEARDARIRELKDEVARLQKLGSMVGQARAILTKQEPKA